MNNKKHKSEQSIWVARSILGGIDELEKFLTNSNKSR